MRDKLNWFESRPLFGQTVLVTRTRDQSSELTRRLESLGAAVHVSVTGDNSHHMIEACFKGVGRALRQAFRRESDELPTTKGVL